MKTSAQSPASSPPADSRPLWDAWLSGFQLPTLTVADELGVFQHMASGPSTPDQIADALDISEAAAETLLSFLASLGYLDKNENAFSLNERSRTYLLPSSPYYWGGVLHSVRDMPVSHAMIKEAILAKPGPDDHRILRKFTEDWTENGLPPEKARTFTKKMHSHAMAAAVHLATLSHFGGVSRLLDIGGGSGCYSLELAAAHPGMQCTVAELKTVCPITSEYIGSHCAADRVSVLPLDMFRDVWPQDYDAVFFSDIFHDWKDHDCLSLAKKAYDSLLPGGRIFLHEALLNDSRTGPTTVSAYSMAMLMVTQGRQFTALELDSILTAAGFVHIDVLPAHGYYSLVMGRKPGIPQNVG